MKETTLPVDVKALMQEWRMPDYLDKQIERLKQEILAREDEIRLLEFKRSLRPKPPAVAGTIVFTAERPRTS